MQNQHRQLAAILFTDIVGYTALMQENEQKAVALIKHYNAALNESVDLHHGKVLNYYGDGSLCSFPSVTEALYCAIELQKELQSEPSVPLRIGLHVGEVFFENEKALGDGVNVASRIQSLGQANTIFFSKEIFDKIRNQPEFKSISIGFFEFKNVDQPMEIFALANEGLHIPKKETLEGKLKSGLPKSRKSLRKKIMIAVACVIVLAASFFLYSKSLHKSGFTGNEKSIAVLPFTNFNNDKENESFCLGISSEITNQLTKISSLDARAFSSTIRFKDEKIKTLKEMAAELNAAAIVSGQFQKESNKIRIHVELTDGNTGKRIWGDDYDKEWGDIFTIQSEVAQQIAFELNAEMTKDERKTINKKPTENPLAYEYFIQASQLRDKLQQTLDTNYYINSELLFEKAITLDPNYALAHAGLAHLYNIYTNYIKEDSSVKAIQVKEINKAYLLAPDDDYINSVKGGILRTTLNDPVKGFKSLIKAYQINPNNTNTLYELGIMLSDLGLYEERIVLLEKAVKLDPLNSTCFGYLGGAEVHLNRLDKGIQYMQTALKLSPDMFYVIDRSAYVYALQGNLKEADNWLKKFFLTIPEQRKENFLKGFGQYSAYCFAKLGNKMKALEISNHWRVYLALDMKEEALQDMVKKETTKENPFINDYLIFKSHLPHKDFDIIRNDPRFLELMEKKRIQYEINKKKFSIAGLIN